jgi:hypothetical protein
MASHDGAVRAMPQYKFTEQAGTRFRYLIDDYGFSVVDERYDPEAFGNSLIRFRSSDVDIVVVLDRGQVLIDISPYPMAQDYRFGLPSVVEFLAPEAGEPAYVFPETWENYYDMIDSQLERLARVLRQQCSSVLRGEFSDWEAMSDFRKKEAEEGYRSLTGRDPIELGPSA